jgi:hypothetical protein
MQTQTRMSSTTSDVSARQDTVWWQGGLMDIKARAEDTGGALGLVAGTFSAGRPTHLQG